MKRIRLDDALHHPYLASHRSNSKESRSYCLQPLSSEIESVIEGDYESLVSGVRSSMIRYIHSELISVV